MQLNNIINNSPSSSHVENNGAEAVNVYDDIVTETGTEFFTDTTNSLMLSSFEVKSDFDSRVKKRRKVKTTSLMRQKRKRKCKGGGLGFIFKFLPFFMLIQVFIGIIYVLLAQLKFGNSMVGTSPSIMSNATGDSFTGNITRNITDFPFIGTTQGTTQNYSFVGSTTVRSTTVRSTTVRSTTVRSTTVRSTTVRSTKVRRTTPITGKKQTTLGSNKSTNTTTEVNASKKKSRGRRARIIENILTRWIESGNITKSNNKNMTKQERVIENNLISLIEVEKKSLKKRKANTGFKLLERNNERYSKLYERELVKAKERLKSAIASNNSTTAVSPPTHSETTPETTPIYMSTTNKPNVSTTPDISYTTDNYYYYSDSDYNLDTDTGAIVGTIDIMQKISELNKPCLPKEQNSKLTKEISDFMSKTHMSNDEMKKLAAELSRNKRIQSEKSDDGSSACLTTKEPVTKEPETHPDPKESVTLKPKQLKAAKKYFSFLNRNNRRTETRIKIKEDRLEKEILLRSKKNKNKS